MTVLDALAWIQTHEDPTLSFRYACRVGMCGSCAMVVNGRERWACRTLIGHLGTRTIILEPLHHFPLIKDLVVDMDPFFQKYRRAMPYFIPKEETFHSASISPYSRERQLIDPQVECITCGACYSACTMVRWDRDYLGPSALNRAFCLITDTRDGVGGGRLELVSTEHGIWRCHTQFNCTEVCPRHISPTLAIQRLKRRAVFGGLSRLWATPPAVPPSAPKAPKETSPRRWFLKVGISSLLGASLATLGGILGSFLVGPATQRRGESWVRLGPVTDFELGRPERVTYQFSRQEARPGEKGQGMVYVIKEGEGRYTTFSPWCTHLGCAVRWDEGISIFLCPCHGGAYDIQGNVVAGPPPAPLDRYPAKVEGGQLYIRVA